MTFIAPGTASSRNPGRYQVLAAVLCLAFGACMILNVEMAGEGTWFWYATLLHHGVRLYADLHLPLQPFYVLETDAWLHIVNRSTFAYELLALLHVATLLLGMLLLLRHSDWTDARKASILAGAFFADIYFVAIRFDDFHVVNDILLLYSLLVLLRLFRADTVQRELTWAAVAGVLAGISFTNRSTDGGMLAVTAGFCVLFLAPRRKLLAAVVYSVAVFAAIALIVRLTGDSMHDYLANSIFHAASAKGGTGTVMRGPFVAVPDNFSRLIHDKRSLWGLGVFALGWLVKRFWKDSPLPIIGVQLAAAFLIFGRMLHSNRQAVLNGTFISGWNTVVQNIVYLLCLWVLFRWLRHLRVKSTWDAREILVFVPAGAMFSASVSQATGSSNSTTSMVLLLLLATFWLPVAGSFRWLSDSLTAICIVLAVTGFVYKEQVPYSWNMYTYQPMFHNRQWYHHPVYGPLYIDSGDLQYFSSVCDTIHAHPPADLLSLPYPYANYFCDTPPWHGYVQTWFDTVTPETVRTMTQQLADAPPHWILYERQLAVIKAHEDEYHGGRPIEHRHLDDLILQRIQSGQWKIESHRAVQIGTNTEDWYLINTRP